MADVQHKDLTGSDLHEPKGADAASANTVYVSDGAGSGSWAKLDEDSLNITDLTIAGDFKAVDLTLAPSASVTPLTNGHVVIELTSNTTLTFKAKGSDGTVRSGTITLS